MVASRDAVVDTLEWLCHTVTAVSAATSPYSTIADCITAAPKNSEASVAMCIRGSTHRRKAHCAASANPISQAFRTRASAHNGSANRKSIMSNHPPAISILADLSEAHRQPDRPAPDMLAVLVARHQAGTRHRYVVAARVELEAGADRGALVEAERA